MNTSRDIYLATACQCLPEQRSVQPQKQQSPPFLKAVLRQQFSHLWHRPHLKHLDPHSPSVSSLARSLQLSSREQLPDISQVRKKQKSSDRKPVTTHMEIHVSSGLWDGSNTTAPYSETNTNLSSWLSSDPTQKFKARPASPSLAFPSCAVCKRAGRLEEQIPLTWERHHFMSSCCPV